MKKYFILLFSIFFCENVFCSSSDKIQVETQSELKRSDIGIQQNADDIDDEIIDAGLFDWFEDRRKNGDTRFSGGGGAREEHSGSIWRMFKKIYSKALRYDSIGILDILGFETIEFLKSLPADSRIKAITAIGRIFTLANEGNCERISSLLLNDPIDILSFGEFEEDLDEFEFYKSEGRSEKKYKEDITKFIEKTDKARYYSNLISLVRTSSVENNHFLEAYREFNFITELILYGEEYYSNEEDNEEDRRDRIKARKSFETWRSDVKMTLRTLNLECKPKVLRLLGYACIERTDDNINDEDIDTVKSKTSDDSNISSVKSEVENSDELSDND